jgi:hypothetical protein
MYIRHMLLFLISDKAMAVWLSMHLLKAGYQCLEWAYMRFVDKIILFEIIKPAIVTEHFIAKDVFYFFELL